MLAITESKIKAVYAKYKNGNKKDAAKLVNKLSKKELVLISNSNVTTIIFELAGNNTNRVPFEDFIFNSLEGMYK